MMGRSGLDFKGTTHPLVSSGTKLVKDTIVNICLFCVKYNRCSSHNAGRT